VKTASRTARRPWIWSVVVDDGLYVRGYNGQQSRWYQAALRQKAGRIRPAGMTKDVVFEPVEGSINDRLQESKVVRKHLESHSAFIGCVGSLALWRKRFAKG
jgi:hypothetical protein